MTSKKLFENKSFRMLIITVLGFSSGLPLLLVGSTLQAWYTDAGLSILTISMLSLVSQPYAIKFLWAPMVDYYQPNILGPRRDWVIFTQWGLIGSMLLLSVSQPFIYPIRVASIALFAAWLSSIQDIAIDAYRVELLRSEAWGLGVAYSVFGYRMGMLVSGGGALFMASYLGWRWTYSMMAMLLMLTSLIAIFFMPPVEKIEKSASLAKAVVEPFKEFLTRPRALEIIAFIFLYKLTDAFGMSLNTVFLLREIGFSLAVVGTAYKIVGLSATIIGGVLGGIAMQRLSIFRALILFGMLQAVGILPFIALSFLGKNYIWMVCSVAVEHVASGLGTVAFTTFLMAVCNRKFTATQFALFTSLAVLGRVLVGPIAGLVVTHIGWPLFFLSATLLTFPSLMLLYSLKPYCPINLGYQASASERNTIMPE